uniref:DNA alkylation repair protein n=1 Tax=Plectus sambesii TaxID=2011161 RepID=A0A914XAV1_9BILA
MVRAKVSVVTIIEEQMRKLGKKSRAANSQKFFKTGKGGYGEGDVFLGITMPEIRTVAREHLHIELKSVEQLLKSPLHEIRMLAAVILTDCAKKAKTDKEKKLLYDCYMTNRAHINNWDLVDVSAPEVVGGYLVDKDRSILHELARSESLWDRRIAVLATFRFIKTADFDDSIKLAEALLEDKHDLIHKAIGWMLREIGKKHMATAELFVSTHCDTMPRTMLRYAIERYPEAKRKRYLNSIRNK